MDLSFNAQLTSKQTEWAYNYHDPEYPYRCNTAYYPTTEEQHRFICAYLTHNPTFKAPGGSASNPPTPYLGPLHTSGSSTALAATANPTSITGFMLDSRAPPGEKYSYQDQEAQAERKIEEEARRLMAETRLWRLANSAMWVAWGIVQAHVPGLPNADEDKKAAETSENTVVLESATKEVRDKVEVEAEKNEQGASAKDDETEVADANGGNLADHAETQNEEEEFDYLGYAQQRALFVWGDAIRLGIIRAEELPEEVRKSVKIVEY
jgi:choline kinase